MRLREIAGMFGRLLSVAALATLAAGPATAHERTTLQPSGEVLIPGIWVDPDGCEHWVFDDGWEGFMSPVILPNGRPVCGREPVKEVACGVLGDQFFETGSAIISPDATRELRRFFRRANANAYRIDGHTDSRGSDAANLELSMRRAQAVADFARSNGAEIEQIRGFGERKPRSSNATAEGRALNRRVEIQCVG